MHNDCGVVYNSLMEEVSQKSSWNKKRIFAAVFLIIALIALGYFIKTRVLSEKSPPTDSSKAVKGTTNTKEENKEQDRLNINVQRAVQEKIESLKQAALGLNVVEIASSSPQVQKIINDIKALEQYPTNQAKEICKQICGL